MFWAQLFATIGSEGFMRVPLQSTLLASALFDPLLRRLEIEFRNGQRYLYFQVPLLCYQQLLQADSKGSYFNRHIRNRFPFQHLSHPSQPVVLAAPSKTK
jgi:KTSC domain-containing protein